MIAARFRTWLRAQTRRRRFETDLEEELQAHVEEYTRDLVRGGLAPDEARRRARIAFGSVHAVKDECRNARGLRALDTLSRESRHAARGLRHRPGYAAAVLITLALAIAANTATFALVNALLLNALPYPRPDRLGTLYARTLGPTAADGRRTVDGEQWELLRDEVPSVLAAIATARATGANLRAGDVARHVRVARVSARYLDVLAIAPIAGGNFSAEDDRPQGPKRAILSHALWRIAFHGDPKAIGQAMLLKGEPHTVIGILPEGVTTPLDADVYTLLQPDREHEGRAANFVTTLRLKEDATWQQADAEIGRALRKSSRFQKIDPSARPEYYTVPLRRAASAAVRPQVIALQIAAGFILLIACANIAGLNLVRLLGRTGEITIRLALGASRWQIQRQLWIEQLLLAAIAGAAGAGLGLLAVRLLLRRLPEQLLPIASTSAAASAPLDARVLAFMLAIPLVTCILSGVLPALVMGRVDLRSGATARGVIGSGGRLRVRQLLIAGEMALTVVLLAAAGLLIRTLIGLQTLAPGFASDGVLAAKVSLDDVRYREPAAFRALLEESLAAMRAAPGVQDAAVSLTLPYERALLNSVTVGSRARAGAAVTTNQVYVTPRYFETLRIPLLEGRTFRAADTAEAPPVVIINQTFARKFFGDESPVGRTLDTMRIVGVVGDTLLSAEAGLNRGAAPLTREETIFVPAAQVTNRTLLAMAHAFFQPGWIVRTDHPATVAAELPRVLTRVDPQLAIAGLVAMDEVMAGTLARQRIAVLLLGLLAALALLLSAVGLFALVAHVVAQRTREIGIVMALGATVPQVMGRVGRTGLIAAALGLGAGLLGCAAMLPAMRGLLYGVGVYDPVTLIAVVLTLTVVTLLATTPILRIARIDPVRALRAD